MVDRKMWYQTIREHARSRALAVLLGLSMSNIFLVGLEEKPVNVKYAVLAVVVAMFSFVAEAADCNANTCGNATVSTILLEWPYGSNSVKVRFDSLTGLGSCSYNGAYNQVQLAKNDPLFKEKLSLLTTAYLSGKRVWFYAENNTDTAAGETGQCILKMVSFQP